MQVSPIVVRGMGTNPALVTRGYGGVFIAAAVEAFELTRGRTRRKAEEYERQAQQFTVKAMLLAVNKEEIPEPVAHTVTRSFYDLDIVIKASLSTIYRLTSLTERIIISAFRAVRRGTKSVEDKDDG